MNPAPKKNIDQFKPAVWAGAKKAKTRAESMAMVMIPRMVKAGTKGSRRYKNGQLSSGSRKSPCSFTLEGPISTTLGEEPVPPLPSDAANSRLACEMKSEAI